LSDPLPTGTADPPTAETFQSGVQYAAQGIGTETNNSASSWRCKRKTYDSLPCGGWVSVSTDPEGAPQVTLGVMGHFDYYANVSGNPKIGFPPPASNRFWGTSAVVELDASGNGSRHEQVLNNVGGIESTVDYNVAWLPGGAITVDYQGSFG